MLKKVLITGAMGRIGTSLRYYLGDKCQLYCLDIEPDPDDQEIKVIDINDFSSVLSVMQGMDSVIHLAGNANIDQPWQTVYETGIQGAYNVFEAAGQAGVKHIIYASSCHVIKGEKIHPRKHLIGTEVSPDCLYGVGKAFGEALGFFIAEKYNISVICLRIGAFLLEPKLDKLDDWLASFWCSPRDFAHLVQQILERENLGFQIFYAVSNNHPLFVDISNAQKLVDYQPQDGIKKYHKKSMLKTIKLVILEKYLKFPQIFWPTQNQQLLLKALFAPPENFLEIWQTWNNLIDIEQLDHDSNECLGLLYQKLANLKIEASYKDKLKGVYRYTWTKNQLKLQNFQIIFEALKKADIKMIWFNQISLLSCYYKDYGSRNISNFSLLVNSEDYGKTQEILQQLDWQVCKKDSGVFSKNSELLLYLETNLFLAMPQDYTNEQVWQNAIIGKIQDVTINTLSPTDQFLYLCLRSHICYQIPLIYWLVDAMVMINSTDWEIDWHRLVTQAQRYQLILPLRNMLSFLNHLLDISIPNWVLPSLYSMPISKHELRNYYVSPREKFLKFQSLFLHLQKALLN